MLTDAQVQHFREKGWLVVERVFARTKAREIAELAREIGIREIQDPANPITDIDRSDGGEMLPRKVRFPFYKDRAFRRFALDRRLVRLVRQLVCHPPLLFWDHLFMKPPHFGSAQSFHQDNEDFQFSPADQAVTAWIALDDADAENGCLRYIDGSHLGPILPHVTIETAPHVYAKATPPRELIDLSRESLALVQAGGVVFHHGKTLHCSHANHSGRWRRAYATHWVTANVTTPTARLDNAYFKKKWALLPGPRAST